MSEHNFTSIALVLVALEQRSGVALQGLIGIKRELKLV